MTTNMGDYYTPYVEFCLARAAHIALSHNIVRQGLGYEVGSAHLAQRAPPT